MTDVDSEMETIADQSAIRDVNPAAPAQIDASFGSHLRPRFLTGTSKGPRSSTILGSGATPFASMSAYTGSFPNDTVTLPSCRVPESFTGSGAFEDYLQQFNTAAMLSGWYSLQFEHRPQSFPRRGKENSFRFHSILSPEQQSDYDLFADVFKQKSTIIVDFLKARLKVAEQQPGPDIATFLYDIRTTRIQRSPSYIRSNCPHWFH